MPTAVGHKSYIQFAPETSYGVAVPSLYKLEIMPPFNLSIDPKPINDPSIYSSRSRRQIYQGPRLYRGRLNLRLNYEGLGILEILRWICTGYSQTLVETGVRDHVFKIGTTLRSLTIQCGEGDIPVGKVFTATGVIPTNVEIGAPAGEMLTLGLDVVAADKIANQTPTASLSFPTPNPVIYHQSTVMDDGTADAVADVRVRGVSVRMPTTTSIEDAFYGSLVPLDVEFTDLVDPTWEIRQRFKTQTLFDAARNHTDTSPRMVIQHPTTIGATSKREFELRSNKANLLGYTNEIAGYGPIEATANHQAKDDPGVDDSALVIRVRSTEAALP